MRTLSDSGKAGVHSIAFLLMNNFTHISLASALEPLRMANQLSGDELYKWYTVSPTGNPVSASDGLKVTVDYSFDNLPSVDAVVVCGGIGIRQNITSIHLSWVQHQARLGKVLGSLCTGTWVLASAGLLNGYQCSVHWESLASLQEDFPRVELSPHLFSIDRDRITSSGGTAPMDMMLNIIKREHGAEIAAAISEMFLCERVRNENDLQRVPLLHIVGPNQSKLMEVVSLMEANIEEPLELDELALHGKVSRRQLERLFQKLLGYTPSRYYLRLRLSRARQFLRQTNLTIIEVAGICGFSSTPHFSKCYREQFGVPPSNERNIIPISFEIRRKAKSATAMTVDKAPLRQQQERGEATYASVRVSNLLQ